MTKKFSNSIWGNNKSATYRVVEAANAVAFTATSGVR